MSNRSAVFAMRGCNFDNAESSLDSSEDDVPLQLLTQNGGVSPGGADLSYDSLCSYFPQECDFCQRTFTNRLDAIKHTATHIIIPLLKLTLYECSTCHFCFTTQKEFDIHNRERHRRKVGAIQSRLLFEDDLPSKGIPNVLYNFKDNSLANVERLHDFIVVSSDSECESTIEDDNCHNSYPNDTLDTTISYSSLTLGGEDYVCKYCKEIFTTRYDLLRHNVQHLTIESPKQHLCCYCDGFFETALSLDEHIKVRHGRPNLKFVHQTCRICNLPYYNFVRHDDKHHNLYKCHLCNDRSFLKREHLDAHLKRHDTMINCEHCNAEMSKYNLEKHVRIHHTLLRVCDACSLFVKDNFRCTYEAFGKHAVMGERAPCDSCGKSFFELNVLKRTMKKLGFGDAKVTTYNTATRGKRKNHTNRARLKNIQGRLKKLNYMNKF